MAEGARSREHAGVVAVFAAILAALVARAAAKPVYEWDLLGYVGCAAELRGASGAEIQREVYGELAAAAPEADFRELERGIPYRAEVARDAARFEEQLGFYRGRLAYTLPIAALSALGVSPVRAAFAVSLAGALLSACVVLAWCLRRAPPWAALGLAWLALFASGWLETARLATPDALATAFLLLGAWLLLERERRALAGLAFVLAVLARADASLLAIALLCTAPTTAARWSLRSAWPIAACAVAAILSSALSHPWPTVFLHSFDGWLVAPAEAPPLTFELWARTVAGRAGEWISAPPCFVAAGLSLSIYAARTFGRGALLPAALAVALAMALRFALFPALWPRLCGAHVVLAALLAISSLGSARTSNRHLASGEV